MELFTTLDQVFFTQFSNVLLQFYHRYSHIILKCLTIA